MARWGPLRRPVRFPALRNDRDRQLHALGHPRVIPPRPRRTTTRSTITAGLQAQYKAKLSADRTRGDSSPSPHYTRPATLSAPRRCGRIDPGVGGVRCALVGVNQQTLSDATRAQYSSISVWSTWPGEVEIRSPRHPIAARLIPRRIRRPIRQLRQRGRPALQTSTRQHPHVSRFTFGAFTLTVDPASILKATAAAPRRPGRPARHQSRRLHRTVRSAAPLRQRDQYCVAVIWAAAFFVVTSTATANLMRWTATPSQTQPTLRPDRRYPLRSTRSRRPRRLYLRPGAAPPDG